MAERGNGITADPPPAPGPAPAAAALDLKARLDRYGEILTKGLDLAEAGLSLGLTVIGTVGAAASDKLMSRLTEAAMPTETRVSPTSSVGPAPLTMPQPGPAGETASDAPAFGITNRLQLVPGAPFAVSFSINNDSTMAAKQVSLTIEPFVGERTGAVLSSSTLAVLPNAAAIAPMDFEKFVLQGAIPPETPPDTYYGFINIVGEGGTRIPVRLVVEPGRGG